MQEQNWDDLRIVLAIARTGTFAAAADVLRIDETTVSRRLSKIEARLDCRLYERANGRLDPTDPCEMLIHAADQIESLVIASESTATGADAVACGRVRVTAVPIIMNHILAQACRTLLDTHPAVELSLIAESSNASLFNREADIAIRLACPNTDAHAISRKLGDLTYGVFTATSINPETLPWLDYDQALADLPQSTWIRNHGQAESSDKSKIMVQDAETLVGAIKGGAGKSLLPISIGRHINGIQFRPHPGPTLTREVWILAHQDIRHLQRMRVTVDWITETIAKYLD